MFRKGAPKRIDGRARCRDQIGLAARKKPVGAVRSSVPAEMNRKGTVRKRKCLCTGKKRSTNKSHTLQNFVWPRQIVEMLDPKYGLLRPLALKQMQALL